MDPVSNQIFNHDYVKFVYQTPDVRVANNQAEPKPFVLNQTPENVKKAKKDLGKNKQADKDKNDHDKV